MTTDNRTNEPTEAMILAGLNAYSSKGLELDGYETTEEYPSLEMWGDRFASQMRAALVAAQGAAPQKGSEHQHEGWMIRETGTGGHYCASCGEAVASPHAPVLPSSGVDEDKLAEVIWQEQSGRVRDGYLIHTRETARSTARAVAEWLKGQGNAARE